MIKLIRKAVVALALAASAQPPVIAAAGATEGIPKLDHVFVVVLENEGLAATWKAPGTYLNSLLAEGVFADEYYGVTHLSAANYIAMTSGQMPTPPFNADCPEWNKCELVQSLRPDGGKSIADQVDAAHESWKGYMDRMGTPCKHPAFDPSVASYNADPYQSGYTTRHDPFVYYPPVIREPYCDQHVVDYSELSIDLASESTTPNFAFITPDTCHDGHDSPCTGDERFEPGGSQGGLVSANLWMSAEVPKLLASPAFTTPGVASALFITTDEAADTDVMGCTGGSILNGGDVGTCASGIPPLGIDSGGLVGTLAIGSSSANLAAPGSVTSVPYDHFSLLRTIEDGLRLPSLADPTVAQDGAGHLNEAASPLEHSMSTLFAP